MDNYKSRIKIISISFIFLLTLSCSDSKGKIKSITSKFDFSNKDSNDSYFFMAYAKISKEDRVKVFESLSDTTRPISEAIDMVNRIDNLPAKFQNSMHLTLLEICTNQDSERKLDYALKKIAFGMEELYAEKIIFDCVIPRPFSPRFIFLNNNEVHIMNGFLIASQEIQPWYTKNDTIVFKRNDTLTLQLVQEDGYLKSINASKDGYVFKHLRTLR
ncbi:MAG: hypothetical protein NXI10_17135 [bacterium]|nr:hypothetical protein [bacterium]